ncbi:MAG: hypothetical protein OFPI_09380 [Osedax symbiont Rs2]|nr:MAG: hypothetical protein OFPI_09380 [Osedax symbiont Rs2]
MVNERLHRINSKPTGKKLLEAIDTKGRAQYGYKVCILRPDMNVTTINNAIFIGGGNLARRGDEGNACIPGVGTVTMVRYNQNTISTPDGSQPNFIGLAHELVHAIHNLAGMLLQPLTWKNTAR